MEYCFKWLINDGSSPDPGLRDVAKGWLQAHRKRWRCHPVGWKISTLFRLAKLRGIIWKLVNQHWHCAFWFSTVVVVCASILPQCYEVQHSRSDVVQHCRKYNVVQHCHSAVWFITAVVLCGSTLPQCYLINYCRSAMRFNTAAVICASPLPLKLPDQNQFQAHWGRRWWQRPRRECLSGAASDVSGDTRTWGTSFGTRLRPRGRMMATSPEQPPSAIYLKLALLPVHLFQAGSFLSQLEFTNLDYLEPS